jgi:hypothetical protein
MLQSISWGKRLKRQQSPNLTLKSAVPRHSLNYILRRQEAGPVSGVPTTRRIIGKREIDVYRNGLMFEKDNVVGVAKR